MSFEIKTGITRRRFFKWLGVGTAAVAVAPSTLATEPAPVCKLADYGAYPWAPSSCTCIGRSFWEGPCQYCLDKRNAGGAVDIMQYADYSNFSTFAVAASLDDIVANAAKELGEAAAREVNARVATVLS